MNVRPATLDDADLLYRWRQDDDRSAWTQGEPVHPASHLAWLQDRLASPSVLLLVAEIDGVPAGQARIDSDGEISFLIDPAHRGVGHGAELVRLATKAAYQAGHTRVKACADQTNQAGIRALLSSGYRLRPDVVFLRHSQ